MSNEMEIIIDQYKKWLINGDRKAIAKKVGKTPNLVSMVLTKKAFNMEIVKLVRLTAIKNAGELGVTLE